MPLLILKFSEDFSQLWNVNAFTGRLRSVVAGALNCKDSQLDLTHVQVLIRKVNKDEPGHRDIELIVIANDHPSRRANLDERTSAIRDWLRDQITITPQLTGSVWVLLAPGCYKSF